jgi:HK97 family phage portal protein
MSIFRPVGLLDLLLGRREAIAAPTRMIGFPTDGGLATAGVSATTSLGLSSVWRCVDILSNGVSQLDWREVRGNLVLPTSRIVQRPQAQRTRREWSSLVVSTLALYDVCYLLKVGGPDAEGVPLGLWPMPPGLVQPVMTDAWMVLPDTEFYIGQQRVGLDQLVVLHRSPQPGIRDTLGGVIQLARITFAAAIAAEGYASRYWQSGGPPTTVLETDATMNDVDAQQLSDRFAQRKAKGPDHAPVLSGGLKAKSFGADPTSEAAVEARRELVADVGRYFGIPTRILNAPTGDTETYATSESGNQDLVRYTLQNYIGAIEDGISDQLPGGRRMQMDTYRLRAGTQLAQAQAYQIALGNKAWMLPEEVRDITDLPPLERPDQLNPAPVAPAIAPGGQP